MAARKQRASSRRLPELKRSLRRRFGFEQLRPGQADVIRSVLDRHDTLAVMPTGAGKSLCYQLPALRLEGTTIIVSRAADDPVQPGLNDAQLPELAREWKERDRKDREKTGDCVTLPKYGDGTVQAVDGDAIVVRFPGGRSRKFKSEFAQPVRSSRQKR